MPPRDPGVVRRAEPLAWGQSERLLEPWLGSGHDLAEHAVPRLIELQARPPNHPHSTGCRTRLRDRVPAPVSMIMRNGCAAVEHGRMTHRRGGVRAGAARPDRHQARRRLRPFAGCDGWGIAAIVEGAHYVGRNMNAISPRNSASLPRPGAGRRPDRGVAAIARASCAVGSSAFLARLAGGDTLEALFGACSENRVRVDMS